MLIIPDLRPTLPGIMNFNAAGTIFQQGGQAWCVTAPFLAGCVGCKPVTRGVAQEANAFWQIFF